MPKIIKSTNKSIKTNMWNWNPDKTHGKNAFSHKRYDGSTRKSTRKI